MAEKQRILIVDDDYNIAELISLYLTKECFETKIQCSMNRGIITISKTGAVTMPTAPIWMTQYEIADLFGVFSCDIRKVSRSIYRNKELDETKTRRYIKQPDGISYDTYSIEMIIAVAFRICSKGSILFRQFIIGKMSATTKETPITLFVSCGKRSNLWYS